MSSFNEGRPVGMASIIGLDGELVQEICEGATLSPADRVDVANHNLKTQTVISGDVSALERAMEHARELQGRVIRLKVKVSSHTPLHNEQAEEFAAIIKGVPISDPVRPIVSNRTSRPLRTAAECAKEFSEHCARRSSGRQRARDAHQGVQTFIEVGPRARALAHWLRISNRVSPSRSTTRVEPESDSSVLHPMCAEAPELMLRGHGESRSRPGLLTPWASTRNRPGTA